MRKILSFIAKIILSCVFGIIAVYFTADYGYHYGYISVFFFSALVAFYLIEKVSLKFN